MPSPRRLAERDHPPPSPRPAVDFNQTINPTTINALAPIPLSQQPLSTRAQSSPTPVVDFNQTINPTILDALVPVSANPQSLQEAALLMSSTGDMNSTTMRATQDLNQIIGPIALNATSVPQQSLSSTTGSLQTTQQRVPGLDLLQSADPTALDRALPITVAQQIRRDEISIMPATSHFDPPMRLTDFGVDDYQLEKYADGLLLAALKGLQYRRWVLAMS